MDRAAKGTGSDFRANSSFAGVFGFAGLARGGSGYGFSVPFSWAIRLPAAAINPISTMMMADRGIGRPFPRLFAYGHGRRSTPRPTGFLAFGMVTMREQACRSDWSRVAIERIRRARS